MKYYPRLKLYKACNVTFNPNTLDARSYNWWSFVTKVGNKVIFNNYSYSNSTRKHQSKVKSLMNELGISIDFYVEAPEGLQTPSWPRDAIELLTYRIKNLQDAVNKKGSKKTKNQERLAEIVLLESRINTVKLFQKVVLE